MAYEEFKKMIFITAIVFIVALFMFFSIITAKKDAIISNATAPIFLNPSLAILSIDGFSNQLENEPDITAHFDSSGGSVDIIEPLEDTPKESETHEQQQLDDVDDFDIYPDLLELVPYSDYGVLPDYENSEFPDEYPDNSHDVIISYLMGINNKLGMIFYCIILCMSVGVIVFIFKVVTPFFFDKY